MSPKVQWSLGSGVQDIEFIQTRGFRFSQYENFSNSFFNKVNQSKCSYSQIFSKGTRGSASSFLGLYLNHLDLNDLNDLEISTLK